MKLYIKQKVFTLGESFTVTDEHENAVFYVEGSFFRIPKAFTIYDVQQQEVATIERQLLRLFSHYDIQAINHQLITLQREFSFFRQSFRLEGIPWNLRGDFWHHNYEVVYGDRIIMSMEKHWFTWGDSYELNVLHDEDAILALCIAICVDYEIAKDNSSSSNS